MLDQAIQIYQLIKATDWAALTQQVLIGLGAIGAILHVVIAICVLIPGEQPEKTLQKIVDWIESKSRK